MTFRYILKTFFRELIHKVYIHAKLVYGIKKVVYCLGRTDVANFLSLFDNEFKMHITIQCETRAGMLQIACHFETIYILKQI